MSKYTPASGGEGSLPPRSHRANRSGKHAKKGCLMAIPQVVVVVARLVFARRGR